MKKAVSVSSEENQYNIDNAQNRTLLLIFLSYKTELQKWELFFWDTNKLQYWKYSQYYDLSKVFIFSSSPLGEKNMLELNTKIWIKYCNTLEVAARCSWSLFTFEVKCQIHMWPDINQMFYLPELPNHVSYLNSLYTSLLPWNFLEYLI